MSLSYSSEAFETAYTYQGNDLGASWSPRQTGFRLWAPTAVSVSVRLYRSGTAGTDDRIVELPMEPDIQGTWFLEVPGNLHGVYYTYFVSFQDWNVEACDPYARSTGVNGHRAMILDLSRTNPAGWEQDVNPHGGENITDAIIYELHVRDLTINASSGARHRGKYLGVTETDTSAGGHATGLDHIKELGVTHVQLMPVYDFGSVDETLPEKRQYNWGYDPVNYNVPEGSYATDPYDGSIRVAELKHMIRMLHRHGLGVIMDVVYNHVYHANEFCFNQIVPGYFSREHSNGSGCGNDTASERSMVRKYIVDSLNYWADEYHIDGFRFDLVGLIDTETIRSAMESVHRKHPHCLFYGEGWNMGTNLTKPNVSLSNQGNAYLLPQFAFFNDTIRDALRGNVFGADQKGYISGDFGYKAALEKCFLGHPGWTAGPAQSINYVSCHDNHTLFDRIGAALPNASREERVRRNNLAAAFCMLSQGIPLMLAGEEMLRTKTDRNGHTVSNSYRSPDSVNSIKWNTLKDPEYQKVFRYYQGLIAFRKTFSALRLTNEFDVRNSVFSIPTNADHLLAFALYGTDYRLVIAFNAGMDEEKLALPCGDWEILIFRDHAGIRPIGKQRENIRIPPLSAAALLQRKS